MYRYFTQSTGAHQKFSESPTLNDGSRTVKMVTRKPKAELSVFSSTPSLLNDATALGDGSEPESAADMARRLHGKRFKVRFYDDDGGATTTTRARRAVTRAARRV